MSTTYTLLPVGADDDAVPSIDITEQSMKYEITVWTMCSEGCGTSPTKFENLTANEVVDIALKMLNVVLYQYPEQWPIIVDKLRQLRY